MLNMTNKQYTKTLEFGKIDFNDIGKKTNVVDIELDLEVKNNQIIFSASCNVWDSKQRDILQGGQCIDDVFNKYRGQLENAKLYAEIMILWEKYHLNNMRPGCKHQMAKKWGIDKITIAKGDNIETKTTGWVYPEEHPKGVLGKPCQICGYKYGSSWVYEPIPTKDLKRIMDIIGIYIIEQSTLITINNKFRETK